jgi:hypothetical protein
LLKKNRIWESTVSIRPVNRQAQAVTLPDAETPIKVFNNQRHWESQPVLQSIPRGMHAHDNLTGKTFGRFRVIGYYGAGTTGGLWVVRCACGHFETRLAKAIRNPKNNEDCCERCKKLIWLKRADQHRRVGKHLDEEPLT